MNRQDEHGQNADEWTTLRADWAKKAELYKPVVHETICRPVCLVKAIHDDTAFQNWRLEKCGEISELASIPFRQIRETIVDFGRHLTGHFSFFPKTFFSEQDAPIRLKFTFGEVPSEINTPFDPFPGALSRGWLQDEIVTVPYVDTEITMLITTWPTRSGPSTVPAIAAPAKVSTPAPPTSSRKARSSCASGPPPSSPPPAAAMT